MTKIFKRAAAGVMALAMCAGLSGCYSENNTWAVKSGDSTLPIGGYIYYLSTAYSEAAAKVGSENEVLKADVDGQNASEWIKSRAMDYLSSYCYVDQKFNELGLTLDDEDMDDVEYVASNMWGYFKDSFETIGIAESSFREAYSTYNAKLSKLLEAMYGKGGEMELSEDELHDYYAGNYVYYNYLYVDLTTPAEGDESGESAEEMTAEEKSEVKDFLEDQAELVSDGRIGFDIVSTNYSNFRGAEPTIGEPAAYPLSSLNELFSGALEPLKAGEAAFVETSTRYYILQRLDAEEDFKALLEDESRLPGLLREMKADEFNQFTIDQGRAMDLELNESAINGVKPSKIADVMGKSGKYVESSSASSESSENSDAG